MTAAALRYAGVLLAATAWWSAGVTPPRGTNMPVQLRLEPRQAVFATNGSVVVDVHVDNDTDAAIEIPDPQMPGSTQPRFTLQTPSGEVVDFVPADGKGVTATASSATIALAPGSSASGDLTLGDFARVDRPGEYTLEASLETAAGTVAAQTRFRVEAMPIKELSGFMARSAEGEPGTGLVALSNTRQLGAVLVQEQDPRNGELFPFEPRFGVAAESAQRTLGWYANYDITFDPVRWLLATNDGELTGGTTLGGAAGKASAGKPVEIWLRGLVTKGANLAVPAIARNGNVSELFWFAGRVSDDRPQLDAPRKVADLPGIARVAAAALAPDDGRVLLVVVFTESTRVRFTSMIVSEGRIRERREHSVPGLETVTAAAAGWSANGEMRTSILGADSAGQVRIVDVSLAADLSAQGSASVSGALPVGALRDARLEYYESGDRGLARALVVRSARESFGIDAANQARRIQLPGGVSFALLPGRTRWYVVWPDGARLRSISF